MAVSQEQIQAELTRRNTETALDAGTGFSQGATFGLGDEIFAGTRGLGNFIGNRFAGGNAALSDEYSDVLNKERERIVQSTITSPIASVVGNIIGQAPAVVAGLATGNPIAAQTAIGALSGFGSGEGLENSVDRAAREAGFSIAGGAAGKALQKFGTTQNLTQRIFTKITNFARNKKIEKAIANIKPGADPIEIANAAQTAINTVGKASKITSVIDKNPVKVAAGLLAAGSVGVPLATTAGVVLTTKALAGAAEKVIPGILPTLGSAAARGLTDISPEETAANTPASQDDIRAELARRAGSQ